MQAILAQDKFIEDLKVEESMHARITKVVNTEMVDKAKNVMI